MPQLPTIGQQNWGTTLNNFLETAHDNTPTNGGKIKPEGILPGSVGQVLTSTASGPAWASANSLLPNTVFPFNLPGEYVSRYAGSPTNNLYTVPPNKVLWVLTVDSRSVTAGSGGWMYVRDAANNFIAVLGASNNAIGNPFIAFPIPMKVTAGQRITVEGVNDIRYHFTGWLVDA